MPDVIMYRYVKNAKKATIDEFDIVDGVQANIKTYEVQDRGARYVAKKYPKHIFLHIEAQPDCLVFACFAEKQNHKMIHEFLTRKDCCLSIKNMLYFPWDILPLPSVRME